MEGGGGLTKGMVMKRERETERDRGGEEREREKAMAGRRRMLQKGLLRRADHIESPEWRRSSQPPHARMEREKREKGKMLKEEIQIRCRDEKREKRKEKRRGERLHLRILVCVTSRTPIVGGSYHL